MTKLNLNEFEEQYRAALEEYLSQGYEVALEKSYEQGRRALAAGLGILDMIELHFRALHAQLESSIAPEAAILPLKRAGEFLAESLSPFEMTHRAYGEANFALRHLNDVLEEEAKRIAHELHDQAGQLLAATHIALGEASSDLPRRERARFEKVRTLLDQMEEHLRRLSHELRPTILDDLGLVPALEFLAQSFSGRTGLRVTVRASSMRRLPGSIETAIYRIVQEALNNTWKHARARHAQVLIQTNSGSVHCSIKDDGAGFEPANISIKTGACGLGLLGIRERLKAIRGSLEILSLPGQGTELLIQVPLEVQDADSGSTR